MPKECSAAAAAAHLQSLPPAVPNVAPCLPSQESELPMSAAAAAAAGSTAGRPLGGDAGYKRLVRCHLCCRRLRRSWCRHRLGADRLLAACRMHCCRGAQCAHSASDRWRGNALAAAASMCRRCGCWPAPFMRASARPGSPTMRCRRGSAPSAATRCAAVVPWEAQGWEGGGGAARMSPFWRTAYEHMLCCLQPHYMSCSFRAHLLAPERVQVPGSAAARLPGCGTRIRQGCSHCAAGAAPCCVSIVAQTTHAAVAAC